MKQQPPKWADQFLRWFCRPDFLEEIEGDLYELHALKTKRKNLSYANNTYFFDVLKFFRWSNFKNPTIMKTSFNSGLWRHNFKITLRIFRKNILYTGINLSGLMIGIAAFIFLMVYYVHENGYDKQFPNHQNIYRIAVSSLDGGSFVESAKSPVPMSAAIEASIPQASDFARTLLYPGFVSVVADYKSREEQFVFADPDFFDLFPQKVIAGTLDEALDAPFQVVITKEKSRKYFGDIDPVGKTISYEDESGSYEFAVMAVVEDFSSKSHFNIDFIASFSSLNRVMPWHNNWFYPNVYTYVGLNEGTDMAQIEEQAQQALEKNGFVHYLSQKPELVFQKLTGIHLSSDRLSEWKPNNTQINLDFFLILGGFILLIAVINYVNLSTAKSQQRSKEIGIKKAMGSAKWQLLRQFFMESFMMVNAAFLGAILLLVALWEPVTDGLMGIEVALFSFINWQNIAVSVGGVWLLSILAGIYPSLAATRFNPIDVVKNNLSKYMGKGYQRKLLVTVQFSISMCLILGTILLVKQYNYLQSKNLGFQKDYRIAINLPDDYSKKNFEVLKERLLTLPSVEAAAISKTIIGSQEGFNGLPFRFADLPERGEVELSTFGVGEDYLKTFGIDLIAGRDFDATIQTDEKTAFIVNQAAATLLGWGEEAVGKSIETILYISNNEVRKGKIIGITEDFHFQSLYEKVKPLVLYINKHEHHTDFLNVKLNRSGSIADQIAEIQEAFADFNPNKPMEMTFIDDEIKQVYHRELASGRIVTIFTLLSILIAALGVFGLATYSARRRIKEIGVRKVLGATSQHIAALFTKEYVYLILIACLISWPAVYFAASEWRSNFAYSVDFGAGYYFLGLAVLIVITVLSSLRQTLWSIHANPVEYLREE